MRWRVRTALSIGFSSTYEIDGHVGDVDQGGVLDCEGEVGTERSGGTQRSGSEPARVRSTARMLAADVKA